LAGIGNVKGRCAILATCVAFGISCGFVGGEALAASPAADVVVPETTPVPAVRKVVDPFAPGGIAAPKREVPAVVETPAEDQSIPTQVIVVERQEASEPDKGSPRRKLIEAATPMGCVSGKIMMQGASGMFLVTPSEASTNPAAGLLPCGT